MIGDRKVAVIMAAGRRRYLPIIRKYILEEPCIDEWQVWQNTQDHADIEFMTQMVKDINDVRPGFARLIPCPSTKWGPVGSMGAIRSFYGPNTIEPDTVYLRVDDDIVHVHDRALYTLAKFRIDNPQYFWVTGNMVNSGLCSHLQHRMGCHNFDGTMQAPAWSSEGGALHGNSNMATVIHDCYLRDAAAGNLDRWRAYERWELYEYPRFGIAICSFFGKDTLKLINKWAGEDDEQFVTEIYPKMIGRMNCIAGRALFSHYAYGPQRADGFETRDHSIVINGVEVFSKQILDRYRKLAGL